MSMPPPLEVEALVMRYLGLLISFMLLLCGCYTKHPTMQSEQVDRLGDTLVSYVATAIELYYWEHGEIPHSFEDIKSYFDDMSFRGVPLPDDQFEWHVVEEPGHSKVVPTLATFYIAGHNPVTREGARFDDLSISLLVKGKDWDVLRTFDRNGKFMILEDPVNMACAVATPLYEFHKERGEWPTLEYLLENYSTDQLRRMFKNPFAKSLSYEIRQIDGKEWIVLTSSKDPRKFIFSTEGPLSKEPMRIEQQ